MAMPQQQQQQQQQQPQQQQQQDAEPFKAYEGLEDDLFSSLVRKQTLDPNS
ncbi:hypothetical protein ACSSS7_004798 [Eimeria intestinalis]